MKEKSERIRVESQTEQWRFRIEEIEEIVSSFRSSLPHPHDFSPSTADACWIPEVRKAIVDGTDQEFQDREAEVRSKISELSATWLEERRKVFLGLLPQNSPSLKHLSLATTLFDCMECRKFGMRIEKALSHECRYTHGNEYFAMFSSIISANVFYYDVGAPWNSGLAVYRYSDELSALVREVVLECGEDPDTITTKEMNRKYHRFVSFGTNGSISVLSWFQAVSSRACALNDTGPDPLHTISSSTSVNTGTLYRAVSSGLTSYRNIYLTRRTNWDAGAASGAGKPGDAMGGTDTSASSKIILLNRKYLLFGQHAGYTERLLTLGFL